jgi:hypothetical protein
MSRLLLAAAVAAALAGCYAPKLKSGNLRCADSEPRCPTDFYCAATTNTCWAKGTAPPPYGAFWTSNGGGSSLSAEGARVDFTVSGKAHGIIGDQVYP